LLTVEIRTAWVHSLKEKRSERKMLIDTLREKFNASVAELGADRLQMITIAVAMIAPTHAKGDEMMDTVMAYIESHTNGEIVSENREYAC